jgi:type IV pilus assembly protein PilV
MNSRNRLNTGMNSRRLQAGISIVESLVAMVILSTGMLGIAGLYLESMRANRTALSRTTAVQLVNDMADRIRANRGGLTDYTLVAGTPPTSARDCSTNTCTTVQLAAFDKTRWYTAVTTGLPNGPNGATLPLTSIVYTAATGVVPARYVITTQWLEPGTTEMASASVEVTQMGVN